MNSITGMFNDITDDYVEKMRDLLDNMKCEFLDSLETDMINDVDNFKHQLKINGLLTDELDDFIDNYLKYNNKVE